MRQRRAAVVVALLVVGPPASGERIRHAAERRIGLRFGIVDVGHVRVSIRRSRSRCSRWSRRRLPFPLQRDADRVVFLPAELGVVIVPVAAHRRAERHVVARHDRRHQVDLVLVAARHVVLAQRIDRVRQQAALGHDEARQAVRIGEVVGIVVVAVAVLLQERVVRAERQPVERAVDPGQLDAVVVDLAALAVARLVAAVRVGRAERVVLAELPVGADVAVDRLHVERQAAMRVRFDSAAPGYHKPTSPGTMLPCAPFSLM